MIGCVVKLSSIC